VPLQLTTLPEHPCVYLPYRSAMMRAFAIAQLDATLHHEFMNAGFRRSGRIIYQPVCRGCRKCLPLRVPVDRFQASKSQRRCWRKNQDLIVSEGPPLATDEKFDLYQRYQSTWHDKTDETDRPSFESFLYESPVNTRELCYRDSAGQLLGVGICDLCPESLSSVYFYHDPEHAHRGLGVFSALYEIETARRQSIPFYYLGFWVEGCGSMAYKAQYRPHEILHPDGVWRERDG
jgi:arginyl-tRNA--protein-N-Asp/Glu arginylyltransferase